MTLKDPRKIRIAFIEQDAGIGGAEINLLELLPRLDRSVFDPLVICPFEGALTERLASSGFKFNILNTPKLYSVSMRVLGRKVVNPVNCLRDVGALKKCSELLAEYIESNCISLIHTNSIFAHLYGVCAADMAGIACVWHVQDIVSKRRAGGFFYRWLRSHARKYRPEIVAISRPVAELFEGLNLRVSVVPNGVCFKRYDGVKESGGIRREFGVERAAPLIAIVGRITAWKGQMEFVKAAEIVNRIFPEARYLIVGDNGFDSVDYLNEVKKRVKGGSLNSKCFFTGFRDDIAEIMKSLDILVLASVEPEPFGRVLIEAMASGVPVVATAHGGAADIVQEGVNGYLVPPNDIPALADAVIRLISDPVKAREMGEMGRRFAIEHYSIESFATSMQNIYLQAAGANG